MSATDSATRSRQATKGGDDASLYRGELGAAASDADDKYDWPAKRVGMRSTALLAMVVCITLIIGALGGVIPLIVVHDRDLDALRKSEARASQIQTEYAAVCPDSFQRTFGALMMHAELAKRAGAKPEFVLWRDGDGEVPSLVTRSAERLRVAICELRRDWAPLTSAVVVDDAVRSIGMFHAARSHCNDSTAELCPANVADRVAAPFIAQADAKPDSILADE